MDSDDYWFAQRYDAELFRARLAEHEDAGPEHQKWCPGPEAHRNGGDDGRRDKGEGQGSAR